MTQADQTLNYRATLEAYIRAWATNDKALLLSIFDDGCILEDPVGTPAFSGHDGLSRFWDFAHQDTGRQLTPALEEIRINADQGVMRFVMQVRDEAKKAGMNLSIIEHIAFAPDGRIRHLRAFWDETNVSIPEGLAPLLPDIEDAYQQ